MSGRATVTIRGKRWSVQVATTSAELAQGLGGIASMLPYTGMLFDLGVERIVTVNAYEMLFPLSVVFIDEDLKVTEVALLLYPGGDGTTSLPCRYFLETNLGEVNDIEPGDPVTLVGYTPYTPYVPIPMTSMIELMVTLMIVVMMLGMMSKAVKEVK